MILNSNRTRVFHIWHGNDVGQRQAASRQAIQREIKELQLVPRVVVRGAAEFLVADGNVEMNVCLVDCMNLEKSQYYPGNAGFMMNIYRSPRFLEKLVRTRSTLLVLTSQI